MPVNPTLAAVLPHLSTRSLFIFKDTLHSKQRFDALQLHSLYCHNDFLSACAVKVLPLALWAHAELFHDLNAISQHRPRVAVHATLHIPRSPAWSRFRFAPVSPRKRPAPLYVSLRLHARSGTTRLSL